LAGRFSNALCQLSIFCHALEEDCSEALWLLDVGEVPAVVEANDLSFRDALVQRERIGELVGVIPWPPEQGAWRRHTLQGVDAFASEPPENTGSTKGGFAG